MALEILNGEPTGFLEPAWETYRKTELFGMVFPDIVEQELKKAFMAGTWNCYTTIQKILQLPNSAQYRPMKMLSDEIRHQMKGVK